MTASSRARLLNIWVDEEEEASHHLQVDLQLLSRILSDFQAEMLNIRWFQLLKCDHLLLFFYLYDSKVDILWFWTVGWIQLAT